MENSIKMKFTHIKIPLIITLSGLVALCLLNLNYNLVSFGARHQVPEDKIKPAKVSGGAADIDKAIRGAMESNEDFRKAAMTVAKTKAMIDELKENLAKRSAEINSPDYEEQVILKRYGSFLEKTGLVSEEQKRVFASLILEAQNIDNDAKTRYKNHEFATMDEVNQWRQKTSDDINNNLRELIGENNWEDFRTETGKQTVFYTTLATYQNNTKLAGCRVDDDAINKLTDVVYNAYADAKVRIGYAMTTYPLNEEELADELARRRAANSTACDDASVFLNEKQLKILKATLDSNANMVQKSTMAKWQILEQQKSRRKSAPQ